MEAVHEPLDGVNQKSRVARRECLRLGAGALPQPRPRGPRHGVRLGNHL